MSPKVEKRVEVLRELQVCLISKLIFSYVSVCSELVFTKNVSVYHSLFLGYNSYTSCENKQEDH